MPLIRKPDKDNSQPEQPAVSSSANLLQALQNGSQDQRWAAARAAADVSGAEDALAAALHSETDARVREAMFTSLACIASPRSVSAIIPLLRTDDASLRNGALDALRAMPEAVGAYLPELLNDSDSDVRLLSCEIARVLPAEEATSILCTLLANEAEANVCASAIDVLTEVGNRTALPVLDACAARFADAPFLAFAISIARDRIIAQSTGSHG